MFRHFKAAASATIVLLFTGLISLGVSSYYIGYIPTMDEQLVRLDAIYDLPWQRISPYIAGVIAGYILVVKLEWKLNMSKMTKAICWIVFPLINLYIIFGIYGRNLSVEYSAFFMGFSRTFWGIGLGWLFIACCTNNGGIINKMLSFRGWLPFSRITYCTYLLNPLLITMVYSLGGAGQHISFSGMTYSIFGMQMLCFFVALWFSMFFEAPYISLTKLILKKTKSQKADEENRS